MCPATADKIDNRNTKFAPTGYLGPGGNACSIITHPADACIDWEGAKEPVCVLSVRGLGGRGWTPGK